MFFDDDELGKLDIMPDAGQDGVIDNINKLKVTRYFKERDLPKISQIATIIKTGIDESGKKPIRERLEGFAKETS